MARNIPIRERFYGFVEKTETCWLWKGSLRGGYGLFKMDGRTLSAHRVSYVLENFTIPEGAVVHHKCGNKVCVRPDHLQCVEPKENSAEMYERNTYLRAIKRLEKEVAELKKKLEEKQ